MALSASGNSLGKDPLTREIILHESFSLSTPFFVRPLLSVVPRKYLHVILGARTPCNA
jgi:hypothetical protein